MLTFSCKNGNGMESLVKLVFVDGGCLTMKKLLSPQLFWCWCGSTPEFFQKDYSNLEQLFFLPILKKKDSKTANGKLRLSC